MPRSSSSKRTSDSTRKSQQAKAAATKASAQNTSAQATAVDPALLQQAIANPQQATPEAILALQQTAGNRAVSQLLSGNAAGGVVQMKFEPGVVQRATEGEEEELYDPPEGEFIVGEGPTGGEGGEGLYDAPEGEVTGGEDEFIVGEDPTGGEGPEEELQMKSEPGVVQREADGSSTINSGITSQINSARGGGYTIPPVGRYKIEQTLGRDFSGVRVHHDAQSNQLTRQLKAKAFTIGNDVFFRQGNFNPGGKNGQELLAHELTHVAQQSDGAVKRKAQAGLTLGPVGDKHEQEADAVAKKVVSGDYKPAVNKM